MYVRRDYTQSTYRKRRGNRRLVLIILIEAVIILGLLGFVSVFYTDLQNTAMRAVGVVPAPTPFASEFAQTGAEKFWAGDLEGARADYARAVSQQPRNVSYLYEYGRVLLELGRTTEAYEVSLQAIEANPSDVRGYALQANSLAWSDPDAAIIAANQGSERDPNFPPLYSARTIAFTNLGRLQNGLEQGTTAVSLAPDDIDARRAIANPLVMLGRNQTAIEHLEHAISVNGNLTATYFQLAAIYNYRLRDTEAALSIYEFILTDLNTSPSDEAKANLRICQTMSTATGIDFSRSEPYCRAALEIDPNYAAAYEQLGRNQYNRRNYEGAIESFERCVELGSQEVACWSLRGLAHYWLNQCDEAWTVLNEALQRGTAQNVDGEIINQINVGIGNVIANCPGYRGVSQPTAVPPTVIPPTPIGGF